MEKNDGPMLGEVFKLVDGIEYAEDSVVSKTILKKGTGTMTLFSFDKGQGLSEHSAPFDAVVQVLDGVAKISINGKSQIVSAGNMLIMPANSLHALQAKQKFKMLLTMIKSDE